MSRGATAPLVAAATVALALPDGAFSATAVAVATLVVWVLVLASLAAGALRAAPIPRPAVAAAIALAGLATLTGLSLWWGQDDGRGFVDAVRVAGYAGLFALVVLASGRGGARPWLSGIAVGLLAVAVVALAGRFLPASLGGSMDAFELLTSPGRGRLSEPIGYWNGLAAAMATAIVLLAWLAGDSRSRAGRALVAAALSLPILALYLTDSRGGLLAAALGLAVLLALSPGRSRIVGPLGIGALAGGALVLLASSRGDFVTGVATATGERQGAEMLAATLVCVMVAAALVYRFEPRIADRLADRMSAGPVGPRLRRRPARVLLAVAIAAGLGLLLFTGSSVVDQFKQVPEAANPELAGPRGLSGSGRYQFWEAGLDAFASDPLKGVGASGFGGWWSQHGPLSSPTRDAHSLFVESLAELGLGGLVLIVAFIVIALLAGWRRARPGAARSGAGVGAPPREPIPGRAGAASALAAALGVLVAGTVAASIDWTWELPAVFAPVIVAAALLTGPATLPAGSPDRGFREARGSGGAGARHALGWGLAAFGAGALWAGGVLLVAELQLDASADALERGDVDEAARRARDAARIEPWAARPREQLATIEVFAGNPAAAREWLEDAVARAPFDSELWRALSLVDFQLQDAERAREEARRAASLDPRLRR